MEKDKKGRNIVTASQLYAIDENPIFDGQSRADKDGNYIMVWIIDGQKYVTHNNINP